MADHLATDMTNGKEDSYIVVKWAKPEDILVDTDMFNIDLAEHDIIPEVIFINKI
jgi:hypothetical protein